MNSNDNLVKIRSNTKEWSETYFDMRDRIGSGTFGVVMKAKSKSDGKVYAIKIIRKEEIMTTEQIKNEIAIQRNLDNEFIVQLYDAFEDRQAFYLQLEMVEGGELFDLMDTVGKFPENVARFYAAEIICGLDYLHDNGIAYRDLKPNNILLTSSGHIKIADFGAAKELGQDGRTSSFRGTPGFMAPEISAMGNQPYGTIVDSWSLGVVIYTMIYGWNNGGALHRLSETPINYDGFSHAAEALLWHLLNRDPNYRSLIEDIKQHAWFTATTPERSPIEWSKVVNQKYEPPYIPKGNGKYRRTS
ncbi:protein kinase domain-containing protein [Ditylenchus destructor]|uniref:Protein kinase domain-containing protein n=1 Tax=Ditylenchus destructor TaxID=166010 RepID=A0AAD4MT95_9BILA|nr:protein kinase domain-containing protein [Ditylenchus destructor]